MYRKSARGKEKTIYPIVIFLFALGIVLGAVSFFHLPEETGNIVIAFEEAEQNSFTESWKNNFFTELVWIIAVWMLSNVSFMAPFLGAVIALRGFLTGFSVAFILENSDNYMNLLLSGILPQMLISMPVLTVFIILITKDGKNDSTNFFTGAVFILITALSSGLETVISHIFRSI